MKKTIFATTVLALAICSQANAETISHDGLWHEFDVDSSISTSGGLEWIDLDNNALQFDFTLSTPAMLNVVDAGFSGDRYQVYDFNSLLGETSVAIDSYPNSVGLNFDAAFANSQYSHAGFWLTAGQHHITGLLSQSAMDGTHAKINASVGAISLTSVPLPAAAWLYGSGCALMALLTSRRSKQS